MCSKGARTITKKEKVWNDHHDALDLPAMSHISPDILRRRIVVVCDNKLLTNACQEIRFSETSTRRVFMLPLSLVMDAFRRLCFIDVSDWIPSSPEWQRLMLQLPATEQKQVRRFVFAKDQNLALASRLLQRHLIHNLFHVNYSTIEIERTPEVHTFR